MWVDMSEPSDYVQAGVCNNRYYILFTESKLCLCLDNIELDLVICFLNKYFVFNIINRLILLIFSRYTEYELLRLNVFQSKFNSSIQQLLNLTQPEKDWIATEFLPLKDKIMNLQADLKSLLQTPKAGQGKIMCDKFKVCKLL